MKCGITLLSGQVEEWMTAEPYDSKLRKLNTGHEIMVDLSILRCPCGTPFQVHVCWRLLACVRANRSVRCYSASCFHGLSLLPDVHRTDICTPCLHEWYLPVHALTCADRTKISELAAVSDLQYVLLGHL